MHTGDEGDFLFLSSGDESLVNEFDGGVMFGSRKCGHVEDGSYGAAAATNGALSPHRAAIVVKWCETYQGADSLSRALPEFGQFGHQGSRRLRANAGNGKEQILLFLPRGTSLDSFIKVAVKLRDLLFKEADNLLDAFPNGLGRHGRPGDCSQPFSFGRVASVG